MQDKVYIHLAEEGEKRGWDRPSLPSSSHFGCGGEKYETAGAIYAEEEEVQWSRQAREKGRGPKSYS